MRVAGDRAGEALIREPLGAAHRVRQHRELAVVAARDDEVAVLRGHRLVRVEAGVLVAHAVRHGAAGHVGARLVGEPGHRGRQQVRVDRLPFAGLRAVLERGEDPDRRVEARHDVEDRHAAPVGRAVRITGQAHEAGQPLHQQVVARLRVLRAESGDRGVDDRGIRPAHRGVVEAVLGEPARLEVLHQDVRAAGQLLRDGQIVRVREVEDDVVLVAVDRQVVRRVVPAHRRLPAAGVITAGALHLDDGGAQVREHHRRVRAREHAGEVCDHDAGQRAGARPVEDLL